MKLEGHLLCHMEKNFSAATECTGRNPGALRSDILKASLITAVYSVSHPLF
jgi:hypothetical protein